MKMQLKSYVSLLIFIIIASPHGYSLVKKPLPKIIFDTDMGPDYDDIGAITVLHALAAKGECEILATVSSDSYPSIAPTIEVFNHYFKKPMIPIGVPSNTAPNFPSDNKWNDSLLNNLNKTDLKAKNYPAAVEVYREVLSKQEDNSVTIVTVGFLSNIRDLLNSEPDKYSKLNGIDLVKKKVKNWVAMAGSFPEGSEFNIAKHADASFEAISKWPRPILFSGFEIGEKILTGGMVAKKGSAGNPVAWAYAYNLRTYAGKPEKNRASWDITAVLCAVRDPKNYFYVNGPGKFIVNKQGFNTWDSDTNAGHYYIAHKYPYQKISDILDELMSFEPIIK